MNNKMREAPVLARMHIALLGICAAVAWITSGALAQKASWSVVGSDGNVAAQPWEADEAVGFIERCSLDELHVRVDAVVSASSIVEEMEEQQQQQRVRVGDSVRAAVEVVHAQNQAATTEATWTVTQVNKPPESSRSLQDLHSLTELESPMECAFDTAFCVPKIIGIRLPDVTDDAQIALRVNHSIVLQFADATNTPHAATREDISQFIAFSTYIGDELEGTWQDDKTLVVVVKELDETQLLPLHELMAALVHTKLHVNDPQKIALEDPLVHVHGALRLRIEPPGEYTLRVSFSSKSHALMSPSFRVRDCHDDATANTVVVLRDTTLALQQAQQAKQQDSLLAQTPSVFIDGVLSHSGNEAFTLRHERIAMEDDDRGSWSLNFWLFTDQDSTGVFRTLFFNGDGSGQHRTPSAWLRPHDRKLVLRVSTVTDMDVGLDSKEQIPLNEWVNIGLTFRNCSTGSDANSTVKETPACASSSGHGSEMTKPFFYSMTLFLNGHQDQQLCISTPVVPNHGPLHLAKGPWTEGIVGFTSQLRVFGHPLDGATHKQIAKTGRHTLYKKFADAASCAAFVEQESASTRPLPVQQQISYWTQCLVHTANANEEGRVVQLRDDGKNTAGSIYDHAMRLLAQCDAKAWDLLVEAAELDEPRALKDMGAALLYGRIPFPAECAMSKIDGIRVHMDHTRAAQVLLDAMQLKQYEAARYLALLGEASPQIDQHGVDRGVICWTACRAGLYHLAAASGRKEAYMVLGRLYETGGRQPRSVSANADLAAYHYGHAASDASVAYHARGKQPLHEMNRLYDGIQSEDELRKGQLGDDDDLIQYQKMRADQEGDVNAMFNMGDLYYWGARGVPRDHAQAYQYFHRAAEQGHTAAQSAVAGLLLKGEGIAQDNSSAIAYYTKAALQNHTRALNGLGFIHFHGSGGVEKNKTLALEYFERAAANLEDGDSVFNAGYCHAFGLGTTRNLTRAMAFYEVATKSFGHFDAVHELGKIYWTGYDGDDQVVPMDSEKAITYLKAASEAGTWGTSVRTGFELFLAGQFEQAAILYHEASEYGYNVATSNLAYLYDQKLLQIGEPASERRALTFLQLASATSGDKEVLIRIGDFYFYGLGGLIPQPQEALRWYSCASAEGVEAGAYNVGHMHEYGLGGVSVNYDRAQRYYTRVLELAPPGAVDKYVAIHLALARLRVRRWLHESAVGSLYTKGQQQSENGQEEQNSVIFTTVSSVSVALLTVLLGAWLVRRQRLAASA